MYLPLRALEQTPHILLNLCLERSLAKEGLPLPLVRAAHQQAKVTKQNQYLMIQAWADERRGVFLFSLWK